MNDNTLEQGRQIMDKWDFILEGIDDEEERINTALVLENSYEYLVGEGRIPNDWIETLNEDNLSEAPQRSTNVAPADDLIPRVLFPVIRRVYPGLIANKLISVQPLAGPTGMIYYIIYTFSDEKGKINAGDEYTGVVDQGLPAYATYYSSEKLGPFTATLSAGDNTIDAGGEITNFLGTDLTVFTIKRVEVFVDGQRQIVRFQGTGDSDSPVFSGANNVYYGKNGKIVLRDPANANSPWAVGDAVTVFVVYDQEGSDKIPDMEFSIGSDPVTTTERKMKVRWTKEAEQDMKSYHKIDVESELIKLASSSMNYEIDREILTFINDQVISGLSFTHDWSADAGNNTTGNFLDRHRSLAQKIYQVSAKIAQYNRVGPANWAVVSPQVAAILKQLPDFKGEIAGGTFNVHEAGTLGGTLSIYIDPNRAGAISNDILLGYKATNTTYGAGVVYAPYTNWVSGLVVDPTNFNSIRGFFSRYALHKVVRGEFHYGNLSLLNYEI